MIHLTAIIGSGAKIGANVEIGPHSIIGGAVTIGDDCVIGANVVIEGEVSIGRWQSNRARHDYRKCPARCSFFGKNAKPSRNRQ